MSITSKTIQGVGESNCLEYASLEIMGEGNSRTHKFSFSTQQPCIVESSEDENIVHLTITGEQEFADIIKFIVEASKA